MANLVDYKIGDLDAIDAPIDALEGKTIRHLIVDLTSASGDKLVIAIERSWQGENVIWAKRKFRKEASAHASHLPA